MEKFSTWTDRSKMNRDDGGLLSQGAKFSLTELLDNVMIYWVTNSITTSMRLYSEAFSIRTFQAGLDKYSNLLSLLSYLGSCLGPLRTLRDSQRF